MTSGPWRSPPSGATAEPVAIPPRQRRYTNRGAVGGAVSGRAPDFLFQSVNCVLRDIVARFSVLE